MAKKTLTVEGTEIALLSDQSGKEDYISLTDIMKRFDDEFAVYSWMRNKNTVEFLGVWETLNNPGFKGDEFVTFKNAAGANAFNLTPQKWILATDAVGIAVKAGRYGGGTFAHRDIAVHFCSWLSPTFQLYLIREFQRLKEIESQQQREALDWNLNRALTKLNYQFHTDAVRTHLIPPRIAQAEQAGVVYASEADLLNVALFGITAKQWKTANPTMKGNLRDFATTEQLLVLANLESLNAHLIKQGFSQDERLHQLNELAIQQMSLLTGSNRLAALKQLPSS